MFNSVLYITYENKTVRIKIKGKNQLRCFNNYITADLDNLYIAKGGLHLF